MTATAARPLTPIQQVASDAAYTAEDAERQILAQFDHALVWARTSLPPSTTPGIGRARARYLALACARVVARLHRAGIR